MNQTKTKTKLLIDFEKEGATSYRMYEIVCTHNSGKCQYTLPEIGAIIKGRVAECYDALKKIKISMDEENGTIQVFEDGINLTYTLTEKRFVELQMPESDVLKESPVFQLNSQPVQS